MPALSSTSLAAYRSLKLPELELRVLEIVDGFGPAGCTGDEIREKYPDLEWQTLTPRFAPLLKKGLIFRAGDTRVGLSGRQQKVNRVARFAPVTPLVIAPTAKAKKNPFLEGMKFAAKVVLSQSDLDGAKKALKRELLKVATR